MNKESLLIIIPILVLIAISCYKIGKKIYEAKKNDGIITDDELKEIREEIRKELVDLALKIIDLKNEKKTNPENLNNYVNDEIKNIIKTNAELTEKELKLLENVDAETIIQLSEKLQKNKK